MENCRPSQRPCPFFPLIPSLSLRPTSHFPLVSPMCLGTSSRSSDQQITNPESAVIPQTIAGDETQKSGERRSTQCMRIEDLERLEKYEETRRGICQRAHDHYREGSEIIGNFLNIVFILFGIIGGRGLFVDLTCENSLAIAGGIIVVFLSVLGLGYGVALWKLKSMMVNKENLNNDMRGLHDALTDYLNCLALSMDNKIRAKWPANWNDRCKKIMEKLSNDDFIDHQRRCIHIIAVISFVVGLLAIILLCGIHCFGTLPPPPSRPLLQPPSPPPVHASSPPLLPPVPMWRYTSLALVAALAL